VAERENKPDIDMGDYVSKMVRLLEQKARAAGVTREEYLDGMIKGKYPQIRSREIDQFRETDDEAA
jgi:hypothetical protein